MEWNHIKKNPLSLLKAKEAQKVCRDYLASIEPSSAITRLDVIVENSETQVYRVEVSLGRQIMIKRHRDHAPFFREALALVMLESQGITPRLILPPETSQRLLVTEYLSMPFAVKTEIDFRKVAHAIGRIHGFAHLCIQKLESQFPKKFPQLIDQLEKSSQIRREIVNLMIRVLGANYTSVSIGDIKPEHLRQGIMGCVLVDLETFSWGGLEVLDLFQLVTFPSDVSDSVLLDRVVSESYCQGRRCIESWHVDKMHIFQWLAYMREVLPNPHALIV
jgi:hypothetical protein